MDPEALYRQHLDEIGRIARAICRRNNVEEQDAEDFTSDVLLKLQSNDYAVLRAFRGRSSISTYLHVVIANLFRDDRTHRWGRWRASAQARRLGHTGILLETLVYRDGHSFESACHIVEQRNGRVARAELRNMLAQIPRRAPRRVAQETALGGVVATERADYLVLDREHHDLLEQAEDALRRALARLDDEDHLLIKLLYFQGLSVAEIARAFGIEQKPLYPRIKRILSQLRETLAADGVRPDLLSVIEPP